MKRASTTVTATGLAAVSVAFVAGCGDSATREQAYCYDNRTDRVVDVRHCRDDYDGGGAGYYFWYFGGVNHAHLGTHIPLGGSGQRVLASDKSSLNSHGFTSKVVGGFGSTAKGSGSAGRVGAIGASHSSSSSSSHSGGS